MPNEELLPTPEELRRLLRYDSETGKLYWLPRPREMFATERAARTWNTRFAGGEAFTASDNHGYRLGGIHGRMYRAHRVIWALCHGEWPPEDIDHINGIRDDNRIENLRAASRTVNNRNAKMSTRNTSGYNGVYWCKQYKKWRALIKINGKLKHIGYFDNIEDALAARKAAEAGLGFTDRHGLPVEEATL